LKESDWKIFRKRVPEWRERYLQKKNKVIVDILTDQNMTPTEQFWAAKRKMDKETRILVNCLDGHSRSKMEWFLLLMYQHSLVNNDDLKEFSEELREKMAKVSEL
jgi:hypothetical protein